MNKFWSCSVLTVVFLGLAWSSHAGQVVHGGDDRIRFEGTKYIERGEDGVRFSRFNAETLAIPMKELGVNPAKAKNTTGIVLSFKTDSRSIKARFKILEASYMGSAFGVYENGKLVYESQLSRKETAAVLAFKSETEGMSLFEIALPSHSDVVFEGLDIDDGAALTAVPKSGKKVYVALGDSISHGVGQGGATHKTWPFLLSRKLDLELYNLAVGGGKVSVPVGAMLEDWEQVDLITILAGYNGLHSSGKTSEVYAEDYNRLLDAIRKNHPNTKIVCITLLYTRKTISEKTGHTVDEFRDTLTTLVESRQASDKNLFLISGEEVSSEQNLSKEKPDPVHLSVEGAALLADELAERIVLDFE